MDIEGIAKVCHEANKALCSAFGDHSQLEWENAPDWQKESVRSGVRFHIEGTHGPEASHINWMRDKLVAGWEYGEEKDPEAKTHPCLVPFSELPPEQQAKDWVLRSIVHALKDSLG